MLIEEDKITHRVVTIGDSSVGKTCIVNRFINDYFRNDQSNTVGSNMETFIEERDGVKIEIQIWDTAGQEQYRSLGVVYYRGAAAVFFVFDLTNLKSFKNLDGWLEAFQQAGSDDAIFFLVGNKADVEESREVDKVDIDDWAQQHNCKYFETSAKTGQNIKELYQALVNELFNSTTRECPTYQNVLKTNEQVPQNNNQNQQKCC